VGRAVQARPVRNVLSGTAIGHPLHPILTDLPIGAWSMATLLDILGGPASAPAADILVSVGIAAAVPTAAAGLNDWSDTEGKSRRTGLVHAAANSTALCLTPHLLWPVRPGTADSGKRWAWPGSAS
jgi:uncharacterized membrane protein